MTEFIHALFWFALGTYFGALANRSYHSPKIQALIKERAAINQYLKGKG